MTCFVYNAPDFLSGAFEFFMKINFVKFFLGIFQSILLLQTNAIFYFSSSSIWSSGSKLVLYVALR